MAYNTPSPSETSSNWSGSFNDCDISGTSSINNTTGWNGHDIDLPLTPPVPATALSEILSEYPDPTVTSAPHAVTAPDIASPTTLSSPVSSTNSIAARGQRYAKDDDWFRFRHLISTLYKTKRLTDVMSIMKAEHGFVATKRMYKARFNQWGLKKNVTAPEVHKLLQKVKQHLKFLQQQAQHGGLPQSDYRTTVMDVLDCADVKRIQKYMKRDPIGLDKMKKDPSNPLDLIRALTVDTGRGRPGRAAKVTMPTATPKQQQQQQQPLPQFHLLNRSHQDMAFSWSPVSSVGEGQPQSMELFPRVADHGFHSPYSFTGSPLALSPGPSPQWQDQHLSHSTSPMLGSTSTSPLDHGLAQHHHHQIMTPLDDVHGHMAISEMRSNPAWTHTSGQAHNQTLPTTVWHVAGGMMDSSDASLYNPSSSF